MASRHLNLNLCLTFALALWPLPFDLRSLRQRAAALDGNGGVRAAGIGATFDPATQRIDHHAGGIAVSELALAADLLETVAARHQILQDHTGEAVFDLDARTGANRIGGIARDEEPRCFDGLLHRESAVDDRSDNRIRGRGDPR